MKNYGNLKYGDIRNTKSRLITDNKVPDDFISNSGDAYKWLWLPSSNIKQLLKIRNSEHALSNMRNTQPITEEAHVKFLKKYDLLQRIDFILQHQDSGEYVGAMYISLSNHGYEIGKYIGNKIFLQRGLAIPMSNFFIEFIKKNVQEIERIRAVTKINNYKNINLNFKLGFKIIKSVEEGFWLMELQ